MTGRPIRFGKGNTQAESMTGKTFGRWHVLAPAMSLGTGARWLCRCTTCGAEETKHGSDLRRLKAGCRGCLRAKGAEAQS